MDLSPVDFSEIARIHSFLEARCSSHVVESRPGAGQGHRGHAPVVPIPKPPELGLLRNRKQLRNCPFSDGEGLSVTGRKHLPSALKCVGFEQQSKKKRGISIV